MAKLTVHKIGGANMSELGRVHGLVRHLVGSHEQPIFVVSAFKNVTDALLEGLVQLNGKNYQEADIVAALTPAKEIIFQVINTHFTNEEHSAAAKASVESIFAALTAPLLDHKTTTIQLAPAEDTYRIRDRVIKTGEDTAMMVFEHFMHEKGIAAASVPGIACSPLNGNGQNRQIMHRAIQEGIAGKLPEAIEKSDGSVLIMGGHIDNTPRGMVVDIGRNYSDTTAVDVAIALVGTRRRVHEVVFWKPDVDGLYSGNPQELGSQNHPRLVTHISHTEGVEIAAAGSTLLQPASLILAQRAGVRLCVRNILRPHEQGTSFDSTEIQTVAPFKIISTQMCDVVGFTCPEMVIQSGFIQAFAAAFKESGINVSDTLSKGGTIEFVIPLPKDDADIKHIRQKFESICEACRHIEIDGEEYEIDITWGQKRYGNVSIIGDELRHQSGILSTITGVLAAYNIDIDGIVQSTSQTTISFYIHEGSRSLAAQVLHSYFIDKDPEVHAHVSKRGQEISQRYG